MEKRIQKDSWLRKIRTLAVVGVMAVVGAGSAWGQDASNPTVIVPADNRTTVHTRTEIIYVDKERELYIPELRINDGYSMDYNRDYAWYVHWYIEKGGGNIKGIDITLNGNEVQSRGGMIVSGSANATYKTDLRHSADGLWWYEGHGTGNINNPTGALLQTQVNGMYEHLSSCASTITYTAPEGGLNSNDEVVLICDVSNYRDYTVLENENGTITNFKEPTLLKRYKYVIRPASECYSVLDAKKPMEIYNIDYPAESASTINISMLSLPQNYFWHNGSSLVSGEKFKYSIGTANNEEEYLAYKEFNQYQYQVQQINLEAYKEKSVIVYVKATNGNSPVLATYTFNPISGNGFLLENEITEDRKPENNKDLYEVIGTVDFDQEEPISTLTGSNYTDNMAAEPMEQSETVYGFVYKDLASMREYLTSSQNQYGLYRSAGLTDVSVSVTTSDKHNPKYIFKDKDNKDMEKSYKWISPYMDWNEYGDDVLYDRTYEKNGTYGFFYYIDASDDPGTLVDVPIDGMLCGYTELVVTAWVADMTRPSPATSTGYKPLPPNINLILKGTYQNEEVVLHRFTSGDAKVKYDNNVNQNLMKWQQLCYRITLNIENIEEYSDFHLEVQNNEPHTDGADYAIDDVCIYKTKPNIRVARKDECDASTLTVSSDYGTLLRNMGWKAGQDVPNTVNRPANMQQYNYGFPEGAEGNKYGNIYFAFLEGLKNVEHEDGSTELVVGTPDTEFLSYSSKDKLDKDIKPIVVEDGKYRWVRVNRSLTHPSYQSVYSYRVVISTDISKLPDNEADALAQEKKWNFQAVLDFNADTERGWATNRADKDEIPKSIDIKENGTITTIEAGDGLIKANKLTVNNIANEDNNDLYIKLGEELYKYLQIPRMRCPWRTTENGVERLNLYEMDVTITDLMYVGEEYGQDASGNPLTASGKYHVMLFSATQINNYANPTDVGKEVVASLCALISPFEVQPSATILVRTTSDDNTAICLGTLKKITAELNFYEDVGGKDVPTDAPTDLDYVFDWYLGSRADYDAIEDQYKFTVKDAIVAYRTYSSNATSPFEKEDLKSWLPSDTNMKTVLENLFDKELLLTGTTPGEAFDLRIEQEQIVAMPYVLEEYSAGGKTYIYCTEETNVDLRVSDNMIPELHLGFPDVSYPFKGEVPLRLGHVNMGQTIPLTIPVRKGFTDTMAGDKLGKPTTGATVSIEISPNTYKDVGVLNKLEISKDAQNATIEIVFNDDAKTVLLEGQQYELFIPFIQYQGNSLLTNECDGLISLPVKIVPEYLTWKGEATDLWQSDMDNWTISTSEELYNKVSNANPTQSYSPLYFTKITIPAGKELQLNAPTYTNKVLTWDSANDKDDVFRYDMAVNNTGKDEAIEVVPYYINDIEQIYFKPGATLLNQHRLTYDKAWVEFEMKPGTDYWMASPLAPTDGGQQNTEAFTDIEYGESNDRWNPAFYQKAWDEAINYAASKDADGKATEIVPVDAVKSNWSIEYNDATVPYSIGKGFYLRVETDKAPTNGKVMVRLPKKDAHYAYETRATDDINNVEAKKNQKNLADLGADGSMTLDLLTKVDNDGNHFLVGNPYMAYLKMDGDNGFLKANEGVIAPKYWTVDGKNGIVVGTPDVKWPTGSELSSGYIAPMQAFFVEKKGYTPTKADEPTDETKMEVTFSADMTVSATKVSSASDTKSFSAVNPVLTLTATSKQGQSRAAVVQKSDASNQYEADKDAVALLDSEIDAPMAYTVAGSYAAAVNAIHDYKNVPLGVYAKDGEEVELSIEGASQLVSPLYLYDAVTRSTTPIDGDSFTLNLTGSSHGRYFLTTDEGIKAEGDIRIYSPADGQLIIASTPSDRLKQVQVYDLNGRMVESRQNVGTATCQLYVASGIYIVRVQSEQGEAQAKLKIK